MDSARGIWLTRPLADSDSLAVALSALGVRSVVAPVKMVEAMALKAVPTVKPDALMLTSRHAAHALAALPVDWRALSVFCVGAATAEAATAQGFSQVVMGEGDVMSLLPKVVDVRSVLYLAGYETRVDVAALLSARGVKVDTRVVYRAVAVAGLSDAFCAALARGDIAAVSFFSPRSAAVAIALLKQHGLDGFASNIEALCLSLNVASEAGALPWKALHMCHQPTRTAMMDLMVSRMKETL